VPEPVVDIVSLTIFWYNFCFWFTGLDVFQVTVICATNSNISPKLVASPFFIFEYVSEHGNDCFGIKRDIYSTLVQLFKSFFTLNFSIIGEWIRRCIKVTS